MHGWMRAQGADADADAAGVAWEAGKASRNRKLHCICNIGLHICIASKVDRMWIPQPCAGLWWMWIDGWMVITHSIQACIHCSLFLSAGSSLLAGPGSAAVQYYSVAVPWKSRGCLETCKQAAAAARTKVSYPSFFTATVIMEATPPS